MKNPNSLIAPAKALVLLLMFACTSKIKAQDTLHLNYVQIQTKMPDTTDAKIDNWIKKLNGQHVDIRVVAYYYKAEFKKYSEERANDLFLILNRKARPLFTIVSVGAKKGESSQRSRVDIIYTKSGAAEEAKVAAAKVKEEEAKKKEEEAKKKEADKAAATAQKTEKKEKEKAEKAEKEKDKKKEDGKKEDSAAENTAKKKDKKEKEPKVKNASSDAKDKDKGEKKSSDEKDSGVPEISSSEDKGSGKEGKTGPSHRTLQAGEGQWVKEKDVQKVKQSKMIVALTGDAETDEGIQKAIKSFWTFTSPDVSTMSYQEAKAMAKGKDSIVILTVAHAKSKSSKQKGRVFGIGPIVLKEADFRNVSYGTCVIIEDGKGNVLVSSYIPTFGENDNITPEVLTFGISSMNYLLSVMDEKKLASNLKAKSAFKEKAKDLLKEKTLYIPKDWLDEKVSLEEVSKTYSASVEVVSYEVWQETIVGRKDKAYVIVVPMPVGGDFVYVHYLMDAKTGMVYASCAPKAAMKMNGINLSKANTGLINSKNIEKYNDALSGDW
jgi:hypothetical protein